MDQNMPQESTQQPVIPPVIPVSPLPKKSLRLFIVFLLVFIFLAGGYFVYGKYKKYQEAKFQDQLTKQNPVLTPSQDETARWQTYRNEEYGFEVKYPENWISANNIGSDSQYPSAYRFGLSPQDYTQDITFFVDIYRSSLDRLFKNSPFLNGAYQQKYKIEDSEIDDLSCKKVIIETPLYSGGYSKTVDYLCYKWGTTYSIGYNSTGRGNDNLENFHRQILSTFKFFPSTKPNNSNKVCIQVITRAKNLETGEIKDFPTPCDVPEGWDKIEGELIQ